MNHLTTLGLPLLGLAALVAVVLFSLVATQFMAEPSVIGPQDANLMLQASVTKTATFNSTALDLGQGFAPGGAGKPMSANVFVSSMDTDDGNETYTFALQDSADNATFVARGSVAVTAAGTGVIGAVIKQRYVRLVLTTTGTTPSITYLAYLQPQSL
ncbi:hypothetical protein [Humisphaera borealis]|uniref:Uncharacterized protein n=1 Tax=Humisphaera borealis TaxID=2807512 RepID=A0A7M2WZJ5_9BACT|nr:hypothetical protein [Humisphaera borealis]QOV90895.1 hypothetical protein IPV69_05915 [Humisphaera borealis]